MMILKRNNHQFLNYALLFIFQLSYLLTFTQENRGLERNGKKIYYTPYEGFFTYSLIVNNEYYYPERPSTLGEGHTIFRQKINKSAEIIPHYCIGPKHTKAFAWTLFQDTLYSVSIWGRPGELTSNIQYRKMEDRFSFEELMNQDEDDEIKTKKVWITPFSDYQNSFFKVNYSPKHEDVIKIYNEVDFDLYAQNQKLYFYLRNNNAFFIYSCLLPIKGRRVDWNEEIVYLNTEPKNLNTPPFKYNNSYTGEKTISNGISDSLFFDGHFKIIEQDNEKYIINRNYGNIYHIGKKRIELIGIVQALDNYPRIQDKPVFIEDIDNNEIIFFAPVKWEENKLPKPKVRIMDEREMKEKFKYVLE